MKIGFDIDDTIANTLELMDGYAQEFNIEKIGKVIIPNKKNIKFNNFYFQELYGWSDLEKQDFFNRYYSKIINEVQPKYLASKYIKRIKNMGEEIIIVSSRYSNSDINVYELTKNWLEQNDILYDDLIVGAGDKKDIIEKLNINIFIDDDYKICEKAMKICEKVYIMDMEANKDININGVERLYSWAHLYYELKKYKNTCK